MRSFKYPVAWFPNTDFLIWNFQVQPGHQESSKLLRGFSGASKVVIAALLGSLLRPPCAPPLWVGRGGERRRGSVCDWTELPSDLLPLGENDLELPASRNILDVVFHRLNEYSLNVIWIQDQKIVTGDSFLPSLWRY